MEHGFAWDWRYLGQSLSFLAEGVWTTVYLCILAALLMLPLSLVVASGRMSPWLPVRMLASLYVNFFRSTPFLVQLVWIFFALPMLLPIELSPLQAAVIGLALYIGAYQGEVVRSGLLSLDPGQRSAALALGMTPLQAYWRIVLPQAMIVMAPATVSMLVILIKESAVTSAVSVMDLMWRATAVGSRSYRPVEPLIFAALMYLTLILPLTFLARRMHQRIVAERG